jgi:hypothetical protein
MAGSLLEPGSLVRAAKRCGVALAEPTASQICALLEVSRGISLMGPREQTQALARSILGCAVDAGAAHGFFKVKSGVSVSEMMLPVDNDDWLLFEDLTADELERLLRPLVNLITAEPKSLSGGIRAAQPSWRALLAHEPTPEQMLPRIQPDLRRHFPLVEIAEV